MLNAFYAAVKQVSSSNFVVTAGTAPYGDPPGGERTPPVAFDRDLFCLSPRLTPTSCPNPPHLDALSHHPYGIEGPYWHAFNADDAAAADMYKFSRILHVAERAQHALPAGPKRIWVTETSWDSKPPDPHGIPVETQARWLEQEFYVLWRQGVDTVLWLQIIDDPPVPNYASSYQAGLYYRSGKAKPAAQAFRFPFVTQRIDAGHVDVWGRAPVGGTLSIELQSGRRWKVTRRASVGKHQLFSLKISLRGSAILRGQIRGQTSLTWSRGA